MRRNERQRRKDATSPCKNIPVNDYQLLFPSRASLYCVPVARANLETKDGWKARSDWPSGPWLFSLIGPRDRTHPVMAALSFPGTLCVRACTLQAASTTPCRHPARFPSPPLFQSPSYLAHQSPPPFAAAALVPRIISKYNHWLPCTGCVHMYMSYVGNALIHIYTELSESWPAGHFLPHALPVSPSLRYESTNVIS